MAAETTEISRPAPVPDDQETRAAQKGSAEVYHHHKTDGNRDGAVAPDKIPASEKATYPRSEKIPLDGGTSRTISYDEKGQLSGVSNPDGTGFYKRNGKWQQLSTDGTLRPMDGEVSIDAKHNVCVGTADGSYTLTPEGSKITYDRSHHPIEIDFANHKSAHIQWDGKDHVKQIDMPDGGTVYPGDYGVPQSRTLAPEFSKDGSIDISSLDGSYLASPNGSTARFDGAGNLVERRDENGATTRYGYEKGLLTKVQMPNGEQWARDPATGLFHDQNAPGSETKTTRDFLGETTSQQLYGDTADKNTPEKQATLLPLPSEVTQNGLGDCYYMATLAGLADNNPQAIKNMIKDNKDGTYTVTFPGDKEHPVTIDAPSQEELNLYGHNSQGEGQWSAVMEKAHRYYTGKINTEDGGEAKNAIKLLTGNEATQTMIAPQNGIPGLAELVNQHSAAGKTQVQQELLQALKEHQIVVTGTGPRNNLQSLVGISNPPGPFTEKHDYTVRAYDPQTGRITLRSPLPLHAESTVPGFQGLGNQEFSVPFDEYFKHFRTIQHGSSS